MEHMEDATAAEHALIDRASAQRVPINGSIELLPLCNMNCDMCYVRLSRTEMERQGRLRTAEEWLAVARQMRDAGTLFLLLTGGEPLLYTRETYRLLAAFCARAARETSSGPADAAPPSPEGKAD